MTAFARLGQNGYRTAPPANFTLEHWNVQAQTAGHLDHVKHRTSKHVVLHPSDGSLIAVKNSSGVTGVVVNGSPRPVKDGSHGMD